MIDPNKDERDQWIPWEISYSLKETTRTTQTGTSRKSRINGIVAVVLPDKDDQYSYFMPSVISSNECDPKGKSYIINPDIVFDIILQNINLEYKMGYPVYSDTGSYIEIVKWCDFIKDINWYIGKAVCRSQRHSSYEITKMPYVLK